MMNILGAYFITSAQRGRVGSEEKDRNGRGIEALVSFWPRMPLEILATLV